MTLVSEVIEEANDLLLGGAAEQATVITNELIPADVDLFPSPWIEEVVPGDLLQLENELVYVIGSTPVIPAIPTDIPATYTVIRGYRSTAASHGFNTTAVIRPAVPNVVWLRHLNNTLRSLSSPQKGLFRVEPIELTATSRIGYDLTGMGDFDGIIEVYAKNPGGMGDFVLLPRSAWDEQRDINTTDFSSGSALRIIRGGYPGQPVRVLAKQPFNLVANFTDIVESVTGIPSTAIDLLALGMVIRAVEGDEIARNSLDASAGRRSSDVPPGAISASAAGLRQRYQERQVEERSRLIRKYGL